MAYPRPITELDGPLLVELSFKQIHNAVEHELIPYNRDTLRKVCKTSRYLKYSDFPLTIQVRKQSGTVRNVFAVIITRFPVVQRIRRAIL